MLLPWKTQGGIWRRSLPKKAQRHVAKTLTQALVDGGCAFLLKKKCKSHQILASSDSPKPNPFLEQIHCQPPSKWGRNHCSYKLSCVVLSQPSDPPFPPSSPHLSHPAPVLAFCLSGFSPPPAPLSTPHPTPLWPPFDPLLPHIYPPLTLPFPRASPQLPVLCAFSSLPFPSLHPPPLSPPAFVCERPAKGEREGVEEERRSDRS